MGWYIYNIATTTVELNEPLPVVGQKVIDDALDTMDEETKIKFEKEVEDMKDVVVEKSEVMPESLTGIIAQGDFKPRAHEVEGRVLLIDTGEKTILRFEDFNTINGPSLHIYLSSSLSVSDSIDLGKIKATKGNVNYEIDTAIDTQKYNKVLVWCVPFRVLFSYAELN